ncbi:MAG: hypothetical protein ACRC7R_07120, partial [Sarcina sp.]
MKYIGPFFRMNSLSTKEIESQLLYLSREAIKHIVLESRCGITVNSKTFKTTKLGDIEIPKLRGTTPLLCVYKKAKPNIYSSKYYKSWDDTTFKKDIKVYSNSLMTSSLLYLTRYYDKFKVIDESKNNISNLYRSLAKLQLEFYYNYLRNNDGFFIDKKYLESIHQGEINLSDKNSKFNLVDQAFMMVAYYSYAENSYKNDDIEIYKKFALEILQMFIELKESVYLLPLDDCCKICFCLNIMYEYTHLESCKILLIDLCDYITSKYYESVTVITNFETPSLLSINLILTYKHTNITLFKDSFVDIVDMLINTYDIENDSLSKNLNKKEVKYSSTEIILYILTLILYYKNINASKNLAEIINKVYKQYIVNSGLVTCFPEAPELDCCERYKDSSLKSSDLIEENMFRIPNSSSPELTGLASIFIKNITYSRKKDIFASDKVTFDSNINFFLFFIINYLLQNDYIDTTFSNINYENINSRKENANIKMNLNEDKKNKTTSNSLNTKDSSKDNLLHNSDYINNDNTSNLINLEIEEDDFNIEDF